jgi:hypothetical protein
MTNILTAAEAANFVRTDAADAVMTQLLPLVDQFVQNATGRDWSADSPIDNAAKAAAGMLLVLWYDNPGQSGEENSLPFGLTNVLTQLEAKALRYRKYQFYGANGAGSILLPGALVGDDVISLVGVYGATGNQATNFESEISLEGYLQQSSGSDLSEKLYVVILKSPVGDVV